eukprot:2283354-Prymnesium_polylepis.1
MDMDMDMGMGMGMDMGVTWGFRWGHTGSHAGPARARTLLASRRAAMRAASLQTLAISAPLKPGVRAESFLEVGSISPSSSRHLRCTCHIRARGC